MTTITGVSGSQGLMYAASADISLEEYLSRIPSIQAGSEKEYFMRILQKIRSQDQLPYSLYVSSLNNALDLFKDKIIPEDIREGAAFIVFHALFERYEEPGHEIISLLSPSLGEIGIFKAGLGALKEGDIHKNYYRFLKYNFTAQGFIKALPLIEEIHSKYFLSEYHELARLFRSDLSESVIEEDLPIKQYIILSIVKYSESSHREQSFLKCLQKLKALDNCTYVEFLKCLEMALQLFSPKESLLEIVDTLLPELVLIHLKLGIGIFGGIDALISPRLKGKCLPVLMIRSFKRRQEFLDPDVLLFGLKGAFALFPRVTPSEQLLDTLRAVGEAAFWLDVKTIYPWFKATFTDINNLCQLIALSDVQFREKREVQIFAKNLLALVMDDRRREGSAVFFFKVLAQIQTCIILEYAHYIAILNGLAKLFDKGVIPKEHVVQTLNYLTLIHEELDYSDFREVGWFLKPTFNSMEEGEFVHLVTEHLQVFSEAGISKSKFNRRMKITSYFVTVLVGRVYEEVDAKIKAGLIMRQGLNSPILEMLERWIQEDSKHGYLLFNQWLYTFSSLTPEMAGQIQNKYGTRIAEKFQKLFFWDKVIDPMLPVGCSTRRTIQMLQLIKGFLVLDQLHIPQAVRYFISLVPPKTFSHEEERLIRDLFIETFGRSNLAEDGFLMLISRFSPHITEKSKKQTLKFKRHDDCVRNLEAWPAIVKWEDEALRLVENLYLIGKRPFAEIANYIEKLIDFWVRLNNRSSAFKQASEMRGQLYIKLFLILDFKKYKEKIECLKRSEQNFFGGVEINQFIVALPTYTPPVSMMSQLKLVEALSDEKASQWFAFLINHCKYLSLSAKVGILNSLEELNLLLNFMRSRLQVIHPSWLLELASIPLNERSLVGFSKQEDLQKLIDGYIQKYLDLLSDKSYQTILKDTLMLAWIQTLYIMGEEMQYLYKLSCQRTSLGIRKSVLGDILKHNPAFLPFFETKSIYLKIAIDLYEKIAFQEKQKKAIELLISYPPIEIESPDEPVIKVNGDTLSVDKRG